MPEQAPDEMWRADHDIGHEIFFLDLHRLLSHFLASKEIAALTDSSNRRPISMMISRREKAEISRLLIHAATYYRVKSDDGSWEHAEWMDEEYKGVGTVEIRGEEIAPLETLSFREACNKVLHAKKVHFDIERHPITGSSYITPRLYLYGARNGREWKATLEIIPFCQAGFNVVV